MTRRPVSDLADLESIAEIRHVRVFELSGRRKDGFGLEETPSDSGLSEIQVTANFAADELFFRCRVEIDSDAALFAVDLAVIFWLSAEIEEPPVDLMDQFSQSAGLPVAIAYLRVHVQNLARQLGVPTPMLKHYSPKDFAAVRVRP